jgi:selenide,water dikinase
VLGQIPQFNDPRLLSQQIPFADAGIFQINEKQALVQSVDFFTPVVDDPYSFGQIAAANALSDLYAVGATPLTALNLVAFPLCLGNDVLIQLLRGGAERVQAAGAVIAGGHSIEDDEPKYGLAVTGMVDIDRMMVATACRVGDRLLLTKPLGCGILAAALKGEVISEKDMTEAMTGMKTLNALASQLSLDCGVRAATDITGFGLLGHCLEMALASQVRCEIYTGVLPAYPQTAAMAAMALLPAGLHRNRDYYLPRAARVGVIESFALDLLCDPQTSGGLLLAVGEDILPRLKVRFAEEHQWFCEVGRVVPGAAGVLLK